jgi:hypothetical protein
MEFYDMGLPLLVEPRDHRGAGADVEFKKRLAEIASDREETVTLDSKKSIRLKDAIEGHGDSTVIVINHGLLNETRNPLEVALLQSDNVCGHIARAVVSKLTLYDSDWQVVSRAFGTPGGQKSKAHCHWDTGVQINCSVGNEKIAYLAPNKFLVPDSRNLRNGNQNESSAVDLSDPSSLPFFREGRHCCFCCCCFNFTHLTSSHLTHLTSHQPHTHTPLISPTPTGLASSSAFHYTPP